MELPQEVRCWGDVLKDIDYCTGYIGKWHLDSPHRPYVDTYNNRGKVARNERCPPERRRGFEYWTAYGTYDYHLGPIYWDTTAPCDSSYHINRQDSAYETDKATEYIQTQKENRQPFALIVSINPPHTGREPVPGKYKAMYRDIDVEALYACRPDMPAKGTEMGNYFRSSTRNYCAYVTGVDKQVGRTIGTLKSNGLFKSTIVVFTSDHGVCVGAHNNAGKDIFYEESTRIPMITSWSTKIKPCKDDHLMVAFADSYPSLLSLMGFQKEIPKMIQTFDSPRHILGKNKEEVVQPYYYVQSDSHAAGCRGLRTSTHTFVVHVTSGKIGETVLYDQAKDPYQIDNIARQSPRLARQFNKQLKIWLLHTNDSFAHYLETVAK